MATSTVENYLKCIFLECQRLHRDDEIADLVPMGTLASAMQVAPGTATAMVKALADSGLVDYERRGGVRLTDSGEKLALHVLRRHRLVELFLVKVLQLDWSEVHDEAEELEHAISDKVLERIDDLLGRPKVDPHGDPIPTAAGTLEPVLLTSLATCQIDQPHRIARVVDQNPEFLHFVERSGLTPGVNLVVSERDQIADSVTIDPEEGRAITVGTTVAKKILVEVAVSS